MFCRRSAQILLAVIVIVPAALAQDGKLWVGPNVNMVSGTTFPDGDPFLQRQNEPSAAVSTRNPLHLLAGANDYRAVDIPGLPEGKETGDSWLGVFESTDGGSTWKSYLLPGYPQDITPSGMASPLYVQGYDAGADPVVRAGTDGLFYYAGIAFVRENLAESAIFVARFEDLNNTEAGDPIIHHDTQIVATASGTLFVDKPWLAVDIPRGGAQCGNVYIAWAEIDSAGASPTSNIMFSRSTDCGANWSTPIQLSADGTLPQGSTIAVAPDTGYVYVAWRQHTTLSLIPTDCFHGGGHWKNHPEEWPVESITMGGVTYPKQAALDILHTPAGGNATYILAYQLIPAKLNFEVNNVSAEIQAVIDAADDWLVANPLDTKPSGSAKDEGLAIKDQLEAFNTDDGLDGLLGPGVCATEVVTPSDAIVVVKSIDDGASFDPPVEVSPIHPFDQGTSEYSFRSNSYPTMTVDETGRVYLAWTTRGEAVGNADPSFDAGDARIVVSTSTDGVTWSAPQPIDQPGEPGHQIKPSLTYTGKLMLTYYDFREDVSGVFDRFIADFPSATPLPRHTVDVRAAVAEPGDPPVFTDYTSLLKPSTQLSRYPFVITGEDENNAAPLQLQYNPPNLPMFKGGTVAFFSDYLDIAPAPPFVSDAFGIWSYNIDADASPMAHAVWTDDRDVVGPPDGDWTNYVPPIYGEPGRPSVFDPGQAAPECQTGTADEDRTRMRNQNIYTARVTEGLFVGVPGNSRPLGYIQGSGDLMQRAFVVFVQNTTDEERSFDLTIPFQPDGGEASFAQFEPAYTAEVIIAPYSSASRTVFVTSSVEGRPWPSVEIDVTESPALGPTPLHSTVRINADPYNPEPSDGSLAEGEIYNPSIWNPSIWNPSIWNPSIWNPSIWNPSIWNPDIENPSIWNPSIWNPSIWNPAIVNPSIWNPSIWNPSIWNPSIWNPSIWNTAIANPSIWNPSIWNPSIWNASLTTATDVTWTVRNEGNATSAYSFNVLADQLPNDQVFQLMVYKVYTTPAADGCELTQEGQQETLVNIVDPDFTSPDLLDPNTTDPDVATFYLEPGEEVFITLRVIDPDSSTGDVFYPEEVQVAVVAQGVDTEDALQGETQQPYATPDISVPTTSPLDDGRSQHTSTVLLDGTILIAGGFNGTDGELATAEIYDPVSRSFTPIAGGMNATRYFHTATLLEDGTVLLVGGSSGAVGTGAEIYDPDTDIFTAISDPNVMRSGHRANLLTDGRVLLTGGYDGANTVASAEVYDPSTGIFTLVGSMGSARWEHSATLLTTGEVLVAGGADGIATTDTVDLFDPTLNSFSPVPGAMSSPRRFHSGTLLPDGTVLLAGGYFDSSFVANATADIYDRATNSLSATGNLFFGRAAHSATLMADGTVLLAGGTSTISGSLEIFSHIEAYDWSTGAFVEKGHLTIPRTEHTAVRMPDGKVVITGGTTYGSPITEGTDSAEIYVPAEPAKFKIIGELATERLYHTVTTLSGGDVIVIGGEDGDKNYIASIERFSPATGVITEVATMPTSRMFHSATLLDDGTVLIAGGSPDGGVTFLGTALIYDPNTDLVTATTGSLGTARNGHTATLLQDGRVLIASGDSASGPLASTEVYDPIPGTFSPSDTLATARWAGGSAVLLDDGRVLIAGGRTAGAGVTAAFQLWDPATETFGLEGAMNVARRSHRHTLLNDGTVLFAGGRDEAFNWLDSAEIFDPSTDTFTYTADTMRLHRRSQTQVLLPSGDVLIAGGMTDGGILLSFGEIYDPVTQTFRLTDVLTSHRSGTRPTRLADGRILIVGGLSSYGPGGLVPTSTVEVYNPWPEGGGSKAVFIEQPKDVPIGGIMSPGVQVAVFDDSFTPIASVPVKLELEDYFGGDYKTWIRTTNVNGIATFDDVWFDRIGPGRRMFAEVDLPGPELSTGLSEPFEVLPLVVTNTHDHGPGSLRRAIENAERNGGYRDTIGFEIVGAGPHVVNVMSPLPPIWDSINIDATTEPDYGGSPIVHLDGAGAGLNARGLMIRAANSEAQGLAIINFSSVGIYIENEDGIEVRNNFVGTNGADDLGNAIGITANNCSGLVLVGNVVSGNDGPGIRLGEAVTGATVADNKIGTNAAGDAAIANSSIGIWIIQPDTFGNTIANNLISGNTGYGVHIWNGAHDNTMTGNTIGLNMDLDGKIPNGIGIGIEWNAFNNIVGGTGPGAANLIAGNANQGIRVNDTPGPNTIQGNWIGTNPSMAPLLGNDHRGVELVSATDTLIGGPEPAARNFIVGNHSGIGMVDSSNTRIEGNLISGSTVGTGIVIQSSDNTEVYSNLIGTDADGIAAQGNNRGMLITLDSTGLVIGGPSKGNTISGNRSDGIWIIAGDPPIPGESYLIENNYIGTDVTGSFAVPNEGQAGSNAAGIITEGSDDIIRGNLISGNLSTNPGWTSQGVRIRGGSGNLVEGNRIGTAAGGSGSIPNTGSGVLIEWGGSNNQIENNTIAHNGGAGVEVIDGTGNTVLSNSIFNNTDLGIDLGGVGVTPNDPGDGDSGANNLLNFPVINSAVGNGGSTQLYVSIEGLPAQATTRRLQIFANEVCDPTGYGEGETLVFDEVFSVLAGEILVVPITLAIDLSESFVTATATSDGPVADTSELSQCVAVTTGVSFPQRVALIALYNSTGGLSWTDNAGWLGPAGTECSWSGVACDLSGTQVRVLNLDGNNLIGSIPTDIGALTGLEHFDVASNQLTGTIPLTFGNLSNLEWAALQGNQLAGAIPSEIGNLSNLQRLYLSSNNLSGPLPPQLGNLSSLEVLNLDHNGFTGSIPPQLGNPPNLQAMNLRTNQLGGPIPAALGSLANLQFLDLGDNLLSGPIPAQLGNAGSLTYLGLGDNNLDGSIPAALGQLANLEHLYLQGNNLTAGIPPQLALLTSLRFLNIESNQLSGSIPSALGGLASLESLDLSDNGLTGPIPPELGGILPLRYLELDRNSLAGAFPSELGGLSNLQYLFLYDNHLNGSLPPEIGNLSSLEYLFMGGNAFVGSIPSEFENLTTLHNGQLHIDYNALYSTISSLTAFLDTKTGSSDWANTQTIAPTGLSAGGATSSTVNLNWTPIAYTDDGGGYEALYATNPGGPYTVFGTPAADKTVSSMTVTGLAPDTLYHFVVRTFTDPHIDNQNTVTSENSVEVSLATTP